ncbi:hypothetical protein PV327_011434, partial [Microctonus hyperodae]
MLHGFSGKNPQAMSVRVEGIEPRPFIVKRGQQSDTQPSTSSVDRSPALLPTALAHIASRNQSVPIRLLIDTGSEVSFITEHIIKSLNIQRRLSPIQIIGIGGQQVTHSK